MNVDKEFGVPSIGRLTKFIRSCIGDNFLLAYMGEKEYQYKTRRKQWDDICQDKSKDYESYLKSNTSSIISICEHLLETWIKDYNLNYNIKNLIINIYDAIINIIGSSKLYIPAVKTKDILLTTVFSTVSELIIKDKKRNKKDTSIKYFFSKEFNYKSIIENFVKKYNIDNFYSKLDSEVNDTEIRENVNTKLKVAERFENIVKNKYKLNDWNLIIMIRYFEKNYPKEIYSDIISRLLERYLITNFLDAIQNKNIFDFNNEEKHSLVSNWRLIYEGVSKEEFNRISYTYPTVYSPLATEIIKQYDEGLQLLVKDQNLINEQLYLSIMSTVYNLEENILKSEISVPQFFVFFRKWLFARISVYLSKYKDAIEFYRQAFEYKKFAGGYIYDFLQEAFTLEMYYNADWKNNFETSVSKRKTPLKTDAKVYWNYGCLIGCWNKKAENTFLENYHRCQQFYLIFPIDKFINKKDTFYKAYKEIFEEKGYRIDNREGIDKDKFYKEIKDYKSDNTLLNIRCHFPDAPNVKTEDRLYSKFSICLIYGSRDERFLDLAEEWIDYPELDLNNRNFNNSTSLIEALTQYKWLKYKLLNLNDSTILNRYRDLIRKIITRSSPDTILAITNKNKVEAIKVAIDCFNLDFVISLVDKTNPNHKIGLYEELPLDYAKERLRYLNMDSNNFWNEWIKRFKSIKLDNANICGYSNKDKKNYINDRILYANECYESRIYTYRFFFGEESIREEQKTELQKIINYLANKK